jgi:hypothetical protein
MENALPQCIYAWRLSGKIFGIYRYTACAKWLIANMTRRINSCGLEAGAISSAVSAGVGTALGSMDAADSKFLSGAVKLGTAAAGKTAEYATYAAHSLAEGGTLLDAYDNMGGLTINVANLGAILDMAGSVIGRENKGGQSIFGDGKVLQKLSGIGLLEVNFGSDGISTSIGMGGIDVGGALYEQVKRGIDYAGLKRDMDTAEGRIAYGLYVNGDWTMENTAMRIANGKDDLKLVKKGGLGSESRYGHTVQKDGGGRTITIADMGYADNVAVLGHEAYRDGLTPDENYLETRESVMAHTELAARMRDAGYSFNSEGVIGLDLAVYDYAWSVGDMSIMDAYADMVYRSDGDYMDIGNIFKPIGEMVGKKIYGDEYALIFEEYIKSLPNDFVENINPLYPISFPGISFLSDKVSEKLASTDNEMTKNISKSFGLDSKAFGTYEYLTSNSLLEKGVGFGFDVISWAESGNHNFSVLEGFYLYNREQNFDFVAKSGNFFNSFPSAGIYGKNLFKQGDKFAAELSIKGSGLQLLREHNTDIGFDFMFTYRLSSR